MGIPNEIIIADILLNNNEHDENNGYLIFEEASIELLGINEARLFVMDSEDNKFIGYFNLYSINQEYNIGDIFIYEKYIVLQEFYQFNDRWLIGGFNVYEYDEKIKFHEYKIYGNKIVSFTDQPFSFKGIYNNILFIDIGTNAGIRGIQIFDLENNIIMFNGRYNGRFSFDNNVVSGLVFTNWDIENNELNDDIVELFNEYMEKAEKLEEHIWFSIEFILHYTYNIKTSEIKILSGEYIYTQ